VSRQAQWSPGGGVAKRLRPLPPADRLASLGQDTYTHFESPLHHASSRDADISAPPSEQRPRCIREVGRLANKFRRCNRQRIRSQDYE